MRITAFVPVRCGSKSIPFKNIKSFCNQPLVYWNLRELEHTDLVNDIVVATDCDEIEKVVVGFGFSKVSVYRRSEENANDTASTESVMLEYLSQSTSEVGESDYFMLVQATSPLTERIHFSEAIQKLLSSEFDSLLSCVRMKRFIWGDNGVPVNYDYKNRPRRQEFAGFLVENGAFYINRTNAVIKEACRLSGKVATYEMPEHTFVEIDEEHDWILAESLMKKYFLTGEQEGI